MFVDVGGQSPAINTVSQATTPCNVAVCGKVLAISADSNRVVVSDTTTLPNQVYIFDAAHATSPPLDLLIDGATAAAFSPDQMKIFILSDTGRLYVASTVDALTSVALGGSASDLAFAADGSFAYVAGVPTDAISAFATCNLENIGSSSPPLGSSPLRIFPLPNIREDHILISNKKTPEHSVITQNLLALEPPNLQLLTAQFTRDVLDDPAQFTCNGALPDVGQTAPVFWSTPPFRGFSAGPSFNLGQGAFTPLLVQVTGDGSQVIIVAKNIPAVLIFDVNAGITTAIPLANNASPLAASASLDGTQVFVGACDADHANPNTCGSVHIVNTQSGGDLQQAVYTNPNTNDNLCNNLPGTSCLPDLIAVRPQ
jgi:DNA-binding beta-propeller fold protein YncE